MRRYGPRLRIERHFVRASRIGGTGSLVKEGPGTLVLSNASVIYSGNTTVSEGILNVAAANSNTGLTIGFEKTLSGAGTVVGAV